jgi:hypothetical protein
MREIINVYNDSIHTSIGMAPNKMFQNKSLEGDYVFKKLAQREQQKSNPKFELKVGSWVRYLLPRKPLSKKRRNVTKERFKIDGKDGNFYTLIAQDGTTITKPRFQLIPVTNAEMDQVPWAQTTGKWQGVIEKIIGPSGRAHFDVIFKNADGTQYQDRVPTSYLRDRLDMNAPIRRG